MKTGKSSSALTVEAVQAGMARLEGARQSMDFLLDLTPADRRNHQSGRIGPTKLRLIEGCVTAAREHREVLPPNFDLRQFERDAALTSVMVQLLATADRICDTVHDTLLVVGNRAAIASVTASGYLKVGLNSADRLKRAVGKLTTRRPAKETPTTDGAPLPVPASGVDSPTEPTKAAA